MYWVTKALSVLILPPALLVFVIRAAMALLAYGRQRTAMILLGVTAGIVYVLSISPTMDALKNDTKGGPFMEKIPMDPWGKPFTYAAPGAHNTHSFDLSCTSPKGVEVNNWD